MNGNQLTRSISDLLTKKQLKRSGFLPMRGRKWLDDNSQGAQSTAINNRLHLLRAFLDQLVDSNSIDDSTGPSGIVINRLPNAYELSAVARNKKRPESVNFAELPMNAPDQLIYSYPLSGWLGQYLSSSIGNSPKRAGFLPMRGRKSSTSGLAESNDDHAPADISLLYPLDERLSDEQDKRSGFMPMRGKKQNLQELAAKRAFHALRGK
jgi:hypothetical protein